MRARVTRPGGPAAHPQGTLNDLGTGRGVPPSEKRGHRAHHATRGRWSGGLSRPTRGPKSAFTYTGWYYLSRVVVFNAEFPRQSSARTGFGAPPVPTHQMIDTALRVRHTSHDKMPYRGHQPHTMQITATNHMLSPLPSRFMNHRSPSSMFSYFYEILLLQMVSFQLWYMSGCPFFLGMRTPSFLSWADLYGGTPHST